MNWFTKLIWLLNSSNVEKAIRAVADVLQVKLCRYCCMGSYIYQMEEQKRLDSNCSSNQSDLLTKGLSSSSIDSKNLFNRTSDEMIKFNVLSGLIYGVILIVALCLLYLT